MNFLSLARFLDIFVGFLAVCVCAYFVYDGSYGYALIAGLSALFSFVVAWLKPSRWIARRMLMARLKV